MSRFLFVLPPFVGHVHPAVSLGRMLSERGHAVGWVTYPIVAGLLPKGDPFYPLEAMVGDEELAAIRERAGERWLPGLKAFWEEIIVPMAKAMLPGVDEAASSFRPDVIVTDQQAIAGALVARRREIAWATSSTTAIMQSAAVDAYPQVKDWIVDLLAELQREAGLEPVEWPDSSPHLILLYTAASMVEEGLALPPQTLPIGPALGHREEDLSTFPWERLQADRPRVMVSIGTVNVPKGAGFYNLVLDAFRDQPVQVILNAPPEVLEGDVPDNVIVQRWLPQLAVLKQVDAVVTHGGSTVNEALAHGLPLVVVPVAYDNFFMAQQAVATGVGVRLRFGRSTAEDLRSAVFDVLRNPDYRRAAERIRHDFEATGGPARGVEALEALAGSSHKEEQDARQA